MSPSTSPSSAYSAVKNHEGGGISCDAVEGGKTEGGGALHRRASGSGGSRGGGRTDGSAAPPPPDDPSSERPAFPADHACGGGDDLDEDGGGHHHHHHERHRVGAGAGLFDYWRVVALYPNFRYYLVLDLSKNAGEWLVRVAGLLVVEDWSGGSGEALSYLAMSTLVPKALCAPIGGYLADAFDRRIAMMVLDGVGGVAVLGYLAAVHFKSSALFYAVTAFRSALAAAYYPLAKGILPLLVPDRRDLQFAVTMTSWTWASMAILGGVVAGSVEVVLGSAGCFAVDSATCWLSVLAMGFGVRGNFNVRKGTPAPLPAAAGDGIVVVDDVSPHGDIGDGDGGEVQARRGGGGGNVVGAGTAGCACSAWTGLRTTFAYLATCGFGMLVCLKGTGSVVLGPEDIVGVEFATVRLEDGTEVKASSSIRMGLLFALIGLGNLMGPTIMNAVTDANRPHTLQRACWLSCIFQAVGWVFIALAPTFGWFLVATVVRTLGAGMIYTYSSLLLQSLSKKEMLGRVLSVEYTIYVLAHAFSASLSGYLLDAGVTTQGLSWFGAGMAAVATLLLGVYHLTGRGAANPCFNAGGNEGGEDNKPGVLLDDGASTDLPPPGNGAAEGLEMPMSKADKDDGTGALARAELL